MVTAGEVSELADEHDLGSCALKGVGVRVPPSPPGQQRKGLLRCLIIGSTYQIVYFAALALVALFFMGCSQQMISWTSS
jgi:hypothetical protein